MAGLLDRLMVVLKKKFLLSIHDISKVINKGDLRNITNADKQAYLAIRRFHIEKNKSFRPNIYNPF